MKTKDDRINEWPRSWQGVKEDILYGQEIIKYMIPFIDEIKSKGQSIKTINKHIDNLWVLGGNIIKELNDYEENRELPALKMILNNIDNNEGPLIHDFSELQQDEFNSTCRKFYKFLKNWKHL
ncbi:MAG: hypothetical protein JW915_19905 [Chitinispirillaceae bacterium]|nr:hypothetical protein [Chitinispirillaceae bacterium]